MSKYIAIYNKLCPDDPIAKDDPRRSEIIAEIRAVILADSIEKAIDVIEWWMIPHERKFVIAVRREARKK